MVDESRANADIIRANPLLRLLAGAHSDNLNCVGTSSDLFTKGPNEKRIYIKLILLFMRHWENKNFWSQGTFSNFRCPHFSRKLVTIAQMGVFRSVLSPKRP